MPKFYCLKKTENKRESHKKVCENKDFCNVLMPSEDTKILELNHNQKSDKAPFVIYSDLECLLEKIDRCKNDPKDTFTTKIRDIFHQVFQ